MCLLGLYMFSEYQYCCYSNSYD